MILTQLRPALRRGVAGSVHDIHLQRDTFASALKLTLDEQSVFMQESDTESVHCIDLDEPHSPRTPPHCVSHVDPFATPASGRGNDVLAKLARFTSNVASSASSTASSAYLGMTESISGASENASRIVQSARSRASSVARGAHVAVLGKQSGICATLRSVRGASSPPPAVLPVDPLTTAISPLGAAMQAECFRWVDASPQTQSRPQTPPPEDPADTADSMPVSEARRVAARWYPAADTIAGRNGLRVEVAADRPRGTRRPTGRSRRRIGTDSTVLPPAPSAAAVESWVAPHRPSRQACRARRPPPSRRPLLRGPLSAGGDMADLRRQDRPPDRCKVADTPGPLESFAVMMYQSSILASRLRGYGPLGRLLHDITGTAIATVAAWAGLVWVHASRHTHGRIINAVHTMGRVIWSSLESPDVQQPLRAIGLLATASAASFGVVAVVLAAIITAMWLYYIWHNYSPRMEPSPPATIEA